MDPREAIIAHAEAAKKNPFYTSVMLLPLLLAVACLTVHQAYAKTQPKPIYQKEEGEGERSRALCSIARLTRVQMPSDVRPPVVQRNKSSPLATVPVFQLARQHPPPVTFLSTLKRCPRILGCRHPPEATALVQGGRVIVRYDQESSIGREVQRASEWV